MIWTQTLLAHLPARLPAVTMLQHQQLCATLPARSDDVPRCGGLNWGTSASGIKDGTILGACACGDCLRVRHSATYSCNLQSATIKTLRALYRWCFQTCSWAVHMPRSRCLIRRLILRLTTQLCVPRPPVPVFTTSTSKSTVLGVTFTAATIGGREKRLS